MALFEREYIMKLFEKIFKHKYTTAIIVAAGSGTRMNSKEAKLLIYQIGVCHIDEREDFRKISYVSLYAEHTIVGKGFDGYIEAIDYLCDKL